MPVLKSEWAEGIGRSAEKEGESEKLKKVREKIWGENQCIRREYSWDERERERERERESSSLIFFFSFTHPRLLAQIMIVLKGSPIYSITRP